MKLFKKIVIILLYGMSLLHKQNIDEYLFK